MACKFAVKYGDKRSYLAKMYPRLTSSVQKLQFARATCSEQLANEHC